MTGASLITRFLLSALHDTSRLRFHDDGSGHVRMQRAEVLVGARRGEGERELAVGVHHLGAERVRRHDRVRDVVLIRPGDGRASFDLQLLRPEGEVSDLDRDFFGTGGRRSEEIRRRDAGHEQSRQGFDHRHGWPQFWIGVSMIARRCSFCLNVTLAMPSMPRNLSSGTFIGPGDGAVPGAGCGKAVERAVWKVTLPSTFCMTWWM